VRTLDQLSVEQLRTMLRGYRGDWRTNTDRQRGLPPPPPGKAVPPDAERIALAPLAPSPLGRMPVMEALRQRRSHRAFTDSPLALDTVGFMLWSAQGVVRTERDEAGTLVQQYKTVPSGGGRHPFETYLVANRVEGLAPGLYRYLPPEHELLVVGRDPDTGAALQRACYGQAAVGEAAAVFIWTAVPYRTEWKYGPIAHRMIAIEAGHLCQNLYLAAESAGAGVCAMLGYDQDSLDTLLGVDGQDEFAIYFAVAGIPDEDRE